MYRLYLRCESHCFLVSPRDHTDKQNRTEPNVGRARSRAALEAAARMSGDDAILAAVRALRLEEPGLGVKPLVVRLRERTPDLGAGAKEVREVLKTLDEERAAAEAAAAPPVSAAGSAGASVGAGCGAAAVDLGDGVPAHWLTCAKCQAGRLLLAETCAHTAVTRVCICTAQCV